MKHPENALLLALRAFGAEGRGFVVVGGTAHRQFPKHLLGKEPGFEPLSTVDVDLAATPEFVTRSPPDLLERLLRSGFREVVVGADQATCRYPLRSETAYLQFLIHRQGDGNQRRPQKVTFGGLKAEALAHIDVLLHRPWLLTLADEDGSVEANIVNPVAFIVQKLLILPKRPKSQKKAKDALYVHDTLAMFASSLEDLGLQAVELVPPLSHSKLKAARQAAETMLFLESDITREAALIARAARAAPATAASLSAACRRGVPRILSSLEIPWS